MLTREIPISRKYFRYDDPNNIEIKAGIYENEDEYGTVKILAILILDLSYNKEKPEEYELKFNCEHLKDKRDQDWIVNILAPQMVEFILKSKDKYHEYITEKTKELFKVLGV